MQLVTYLASPHRMVARGRGARSSMFEQIALAFPCRSVWGKSQSEMRRLTGQIGGDSRGRRALRRELHEIHELNGLLGLLRLASKPGREVVQVYNSCGKSG
jgi:hypothetical protein